MRAKITKICLIAFLGTFCLHSEQNTISQPIEGYRWQFLQPLNANVLIPIGWHLNYQPEFVDEHSKIILANKVFITPEPVSPQDPMKRFEIFGGILIQVYPSKKADEDALQKKYNRMINAIPGRPINRFIGEFESTRFEPRPAHGISHLTQVTIIIKNNRDFLIYYIMIAAPNDQWIDSWPVMRQAVNLIQWIPNK
jgi:hypothetical protein